MEDQRFTYEINTISFSFLEIESVLTFITAALTTYVFYLESKTYQHKWDIFYVTNCHIICIQSNHWDGASEVIIKIKSS